MFKKNLSIILVFLFIIFNINILEASSITIISKENFEKQKLEINVWEMLIFFGQMYKNKIPESYKYIDLQFTWIEKSSKIYSSLQKLVFVDIINNNSIRLNLDKKINAFAFYRFAEKNYKVNLIKDWEINKLKWRNAIFQDFENIKNRLQITKSDFSLNKKWIKLNTKKEIFADVYKTLLRWHYNRDNLDKNKMIEEAIKGLAKWTWDKFTTFFPAIDNKKFNEALTWEYEWIWSYVDMESPGVLKIVSPMPGSPSEKAWLKWGDIVTHVDEKKITEKNWLSEVVSWIKGPAWTKVVLTIKRWDEILILEVIRARIILTEIESKKLNPTTLYIKMKFFWPKISSEFRKSLEILKTDKNINKIIFDLRWNWWWYLDEVSSILSHFVPKWEATAIVKYHNSQTKYRSKGYNDIDFSKYKLVVLQNSWTASASEIFIWTLKDYFPKTTVIWEQSHWKGSVQTIKSYKDWSSLKYTVATWYTWKTKTWINKIWITPDIVMEMEKYWVEKSKDIQLQKALKLR